MVPCYPFPVTFYTALQYSKCHPSNTQPPTRIFTLEWNLSAPCFAKCTKKMSWFHQFFPLALFARVHASLLVKWSGICKVDNRITPPFYWQKLGRSAAHAHLSRAVSASDTWSRWRHDEQWILSMLLTPHLIVWKPSVPPQFTQNKAAVYPYSCFKWYSTPQCLQWKFIWKIWKCISYCCFKPSRQCFFFYFHWSFLFISLLLSLSYWVPFPS